MTITNVQVCDKNDNYTKLAFPHTHTYTQCRYWYPSGCLPVGEQYPDVVALVLVSFSLETLLALILGVSLFSVGVDERKPRRRAVSADMRDEEVLVRVTVHSESLRAEMEPRRVLRGWASMSSLESPFRPGGGLDVELVVDTSEATDTLSASARSVSDVSPNRARRRREALVGRGWGRDVCLFSEEVVAAWRVRLALDAFVEVNADLLSDLECPNGPE